LRRLHREMHITTVFVTHDQEEAFELADRVVVMNGGRIRQSGAPMQLYRRPVDPFVCRFLGEANEIPCRIENGFVIADAGFLLGRAEMGTGGGIAYVRPHQIALRPNEAGDWRVAELTAGGAMSRVGVARDGLSLEASLASERALALGLQAGMGVEVEIAGGMVMGDAADAPVTLLPAPHRDRPLLTERKIEKDEKEEPSFSEEKEAKRLLSVIRTYDSSRDFERRDKNR
ncbi:MAG TPA: hypothetical protein VMA86_02140, partial [Acetobacteraceae bacterium]|nr:hypothetical protein [Acetobacteraceae bacterium]